MRTISIDERRRAMTARHHLAGTAASPEDATRAVIALHATDPASVYLSVLARCSSCTLADVAASMYERRSLVRWLAMRRTLFVFDRDDVPVVQAAVSDSVAASLRTQLVNRMTRDGADPPVDDNVDDWLQSLSVGVERAVQELGSATGAQLAAAEPRLQTSLLPRTTSEPPQKLTTRLLTILGAEGRLVRGTPTGPWTSRHHRWEPARAWWPDGLPDVDAESARQALARRWLERFGPATAADLQWWTGWSKTVTRRVLTALPVEEVDLHGQVGIALAEGDVNADPSTPDSEPVAALLPALDPTPMGWKERDWFFAIDPRELFDRTGNIGPTIWWDDRIIGSWVTGPDGTIRTGIRTDVGSDAARAVQAVAEQLEVRLDGVTVTPAARTPLERSLIAGADRT